MTELYLNREKLFGTDGIRGTPGVYPLTDGMIYKIGSGIARFLSSYKKESKNKRKAVIGKDTRLSGQRIQSILAEAINAQGIDVLQVGIIASPGLSFLTKHFDADMGIMISASHNKASDNGIKFFNSKGHKLSCQEEEKLEKIIFEGLTNQTAELRSKRKGKVRIVKDAQAKYVKFLTSTLEGLNLKGMRIAIDCACGAASLFAKKLFNRLGAKVYAINDKPQGDSINQGGALDPGSLKDLVLKSGAHIGIAVDGDGDRGILVDEKGEILDGDFIMAIIARYLIEKNKLAQNAIVTTVMSNYGLRTSIEESGGQAIITDVGDKYVLEALLKNNLNFGGEQSGHIIFLEYLPTPDGLLTGLQLLKLMQNKKFTLSELRKCMTKFPQVLVNVKVKEKKPFEEMSSLNEKLSSFTEQLKNEGRILLRYSGTEPLARVMVEGKNKELIEEIANSLASEIRQEIGVE